MPVGGVRAYARHRGVSHTTVLKAIKTGRIRAPGGVIDFKAADKSWAATTDTTKPRNSVNGNPRGSGRWGNQRAGAAAPGNGTEAPRGEAEPSAGPGSYAQARGAREAYLARMAKLDYEKAIGKVVDADAVKAKWFEVGRKVRESVMTAADRVSPLVAGMSDVVEVHRLITEELRVALEGLALSTPPLPGRGE